MSRVVDTAVVTPNEQFDYWRELASELFPLLQIEPVSSGAFRAVSWVQELCGIMVSETISDAIVLRRTTQCIRRDDPGVLALVVMTSGRSVFSQGSQSSICGPGDLVLCDSSKPYTVGAREPTSVLTMALPKSLLGLDGTRRIGERPLSISANSPRGRLIVPFFRELAHGLRRGDIKPDELELAESVRSLVLSLHDPGERSTPRPDLLLQAKAFIDANLAEPHLDADAVASSLYVSRRYLYKLFEAAGMGVREWIQTRRLERCRGDLGDPRLRDESIFSIAIQWGFRNAPHFSHSFREAYGITPSAYREAKLESQESSSAPRTSTGRRIVPPQSRPVAPEIVA